MPKLFMLLLGSKPSDRNIEQHDIFFGIANSVRDLIPEIKLFWPVEKVHVDAWRAVTVVNGYSVQVVCLSELGFLGRKDDRIVQTQKQERNNTAQLFFINLGGYKEYEFEEFHYKMIVAANDKGAAIQQAKQTAFYKHTGFKGAPSHVDDKYGVDVDDVYAIQDILPAPVKQQYSLLIEPAGADQREDELHLGYFRLEAVDEWGDDFI